MFYEEFKLKSGKSRLGLPFVTKKTASLTSTCNVTFFIHRLIVAKPERRLKKGSGFHMDIVIMSVVNGLCGLFGAPWQCVATVRSVSHVSALTVMSTTHAPGDKPHIVEVKGTLTCKML